jgi:hypothetical protein
MSVGNVMRRAYAHQTFQMVISRLLIASSWMANMRWA